MERSGLVDLLQRQHGVIARWQALDAGAAPWLIRRELQAGRWEELAPAVYGLCGHRRSWRRALWVAHLHAGPSSLVSHESAGRLRGFSQLPAGRVVVSVPHRRRHAPPGVRWRRVDDLAAGDASSIDGLPVTSLARTLESQALGYETTRLLWEHAQSDPSGTATLEFARLHDSSSLGGAGTFRVGRPPTSLTTSVRALRRARVPVPREY